MHPSRSIAVKATKTILPNYTSTPFQKSKFHYPCLKPLLLTIPTSSLDSIAKALRVWYSSKFQTVYADWVLDFFISKFYLFLFCFTTLVGHSSRAAARTS
jgi:hypothetical protein